MWPHLPPLRGLVAAGIVEAHHPGIADAEVVNFEIRIAALQTHTQAGAGIYNLTERLFLTLSLTHVSSLLLQGVPRGGISRGERTSFTPVYCLA